MKDKTQNTSFLQLASISLFIVCEASIIGPFLAPFIKSCGISLAWVGVVLSFKNVSSMLLEVPTAIIMKYFGPKMVFTISRLARLSSVTLLMYKQTKPFLLMSMALYGLSMASFYGKIDAYLMQIPRGKHLTGRILLSGYSIIAQITMIVCGTLSAYLFPRVGYTSLAFYTVLTSILSLLLLPIMPNPTVDTNPLSNKTPLKEKLKDFWTIANKSKKVIKLAITLGIINVIIWRSNNVLNIVLLKIGVETQSIPIISTAHFGCTILGYIIALISKEIKETTANRIYLFCVALLTIAIPMLNWVSLVAFLVMSTGLALVQIFYEKELFSSIGSKSNTVTVISMVNLGASLYAILSGTINGFLAQRLVSNYTLLPTVLPVALVAIIVCLTNRRKEL